VDIENRDIIMFETPSVLIPVTHRVIGVSDTGIITKGDARRSRDDWVVKNEQIMGKAITINEKPIIIKDVGIYFIEDFKSGIMTPRYNEEFILMRKIITTIKSLGLVIFFCAIFMYILSSIRS
jgi:signal peptidase